MPASPRKSPRRARQAETETRIPPAHDWRTSDQDEINRRRIRAQAEQPRIRNLDPAHRIFSDFEVQSGSGLRYRIEIRDLRERQFSCGCVDFRVNGLGTCKHIEAVLAHLETRFPHLFRRAQKSGSERIDLVADPLSDTLRIERGRAKLPAKLRAFFRPDGQLKNGAAAEAVNHLRAAGVIGLRLSQEIEPWLEARRRAEERTLDQRAYEEKIRLGEYPPHETLMPLYPYQREGMLHLAFTERALLADEMGLGKTIQAIAACALLHRLGKAQRALVITPASLKTEWEEQIQKFTRLPYQIVYGHRHQRLDAYSRAPFFTLVNYEQMVGDALEVNARLRPDIVVLDEAQRIKNWSTKTAQAVKRLQSRYAFVLTGTPIENRIDEIFSIVNFLDPAVFGPLFRFNREFYELDERGRPAEYRNLGKLHERIRPLMIRRRKADVETELPSRVDRNLFVPLSPTQQATYEDHSGQVARLMQAAKRRPLTKQEQDKLMRELAMMRMICDSNYILDANDRVCPKLGELEKILEQCRETPEVKVIIFSEWERMLELARGVCERMRLGFAWHTGSVPQQRRRAEIQMFKTEPACRIFLSTDSGGVGLNLQNASVVINCDLPWNPAKLEQRIARAWRKHQTRNVTVINLISAETIEHRMLGTLAAKKGLAGGVLDREGELDRIPLKGGAQAFLSRLDQILSPASSVPLAEKKAVSLPADRAAGFAAQLKVLLQGELVACEQRFPQEGAHSVFVIVVERDAATWRERLRPVHEQFFGQSDPLAPVQFEVIDRGTADALKRLAEAGLVQTTIRTTRHLYPETASAMAPLSEAERHEAAAARDRASRKLRLARILAAEDLAEEARPALIEALHQLNSAEAIEHRLLAPTTASDALVEPWNLRWLDSAAVLREFLGNDVANPASILALLQSRCTGDRER